MNELTDKLILCMVQVTLVGVVAIVLHLFAARRGPAAGSRVLTLYLGSPSS